MKITIGIDKSVVTAKDRIADPSRIVGDIVVKVWADQDGKRYIEASGFVDRNMAQRANINLVKMEAKRLVSRVVGRLIDEGEIE